jgi:uncharacterized integral membrane protein (TIGR00698 family)
VCWSNEGLDLDAALSGSGLDPPQCRACLGENAPPARAGRFRRSDLGSATRTDEMTSPGRLPAGGRASRRVSARTFAGAALCVAVAGAATLTGHVAPIIGAPVIGLVIGAAIAVIRRPPESMVAGITFCSHQVLQVAVASLGLQLTLGQAVSSGARSLPVLVGTLAICLLGAALFGHLLRVRSPLRTLVGVGTAICGASAIAAITPVIDAAATDVAYALSTVFVFNAVAVVLFPLIGHALAMSQDAFGLFAGTAINDTSSVVAAGYVYGPGAGQHAVVVKLTRTLFIIPITLVLALRRARAGSGTRLPRITHLVPWFVIAFVAASAVVSLVPPSTSLRSVFSAVALFLITIALSAIGLLTDLAALRRTGPRPLLLGSLLWALVSLSSLALAAASVIH